MTAAAPWSVRLQHLLPRRALSQALGRLAAAHGGRLTEWAVRAFIRRYKVDMSEAAQPDPAAYPSFNAFFTRALAPGVRPLAEAPWLSPVDGAVSQLGAIEGGACAAQASNFFYHVQWQWQWHMVITRQQEPCGSGRVPLIWRQARQRLRRRPAHLNSREGLFASTTSCRSAAAWPAWPLPPADTWCQNRV